MPKRTLFSGVQHSQVTSAVNYSPSIVSTGYDRVIAHRTSELYSKVAKQDGVVTKITKEGMIITYKDGTEDTYPLDLVLGSGSGEVHKHFRVTDLKEGDEFKAGDILGWDDVYFERDKLFNPRQVIWKAGVKTRLALKEDQFTYEDSISIVKTMAKETKTPYIKEKVCFIKFEDGVKVHVDIGSEVSRESILCDVIDSSLLGFMDDVGDDDLERLGIKQYHSNHFGKIIDIKVEYNGDPSLMSESLKAYVKASDKKLAKKEKIIKDGITTGNHTGNLNLGRDVIEPGTVAIKFLIESMIETVVADKFVIGNQMKGTVGFIHNYPVVTEDGRNVDLMFSLKSLFSRMVLSLRDKLVLGELAEHIKTEIIKIYKE